MKSMIRCVGGPWDGRLIETPSGPHLRVRNPAMASAYDGRECLPPDIARTDHVIYTRRFLCSYSHNEKDEITFLAPETMSDINAVRHLLKI